MNYIHGTLFIILILSIFTFAPIKSIEANQQNDILVVVTDFMATNHSVANHTHTESFVQVLTNINETTDFAFIDASDPYNVIGPRNRNQDDFDVSVGKFIHQLSQNPVENNEGLLSALRESLSILGSKNASEKSGVFLITGKSNRKFEGLAAQTASLSNRFKSKSWHIDGIALPDHNTDSIYFLDQITSRTGGELFKLTIPDGYEKLINQLMQKNSSTKHLRNITHNQLDLNESMRSAIHIAPGTKETTVVVLRESSLGKIALGNPSGYLVSETSARTIILNSPHVLIWKLFEPDPGNWSFELNGFEGHVSTWESSKNKYSINLLANGTLPQNQPIALSVQILDGETPTSVNNANLYANITGPSNSSIIYKLSNENSTSNNGFGVYSTVIPALTEIGTHKIKLELEWKNHNYKLSTVSNIEIKPFPKLIVNQENNTVAELNQRTKIGSLSVQISQSAFTIKPEQIELITSSENKSEIKIEIIPSDTYPGNTASDFDIFVTPQNHDNFTFSFNLKGEYSGQSYFYVGDQITFSSIPKLIENISTKTKTESNQTSINDVTPISSNIHPAPIDIDVPSGSEINLIAIYSLSIIAIIILAAYIYWSNQVNPYGLLRDEKDSQNIDLSNIQRSMLSKLISKNMISGREIKLPGLEQTSFHFSRKGVSIINKNKDKAIRVNNQPILIKAKLHDKTWIGSSGKLYTFTFK